eukprot:SAG31_NODE_40752_length_279_cov_0.738889_1_plen_80_part_10
MCTNQCTTEPGECDAEGCKASTWKTEYFPNNALDGEPEEVRCEDFAINRHWDQGGVTRLGMQTDHFSIRWTGSFHFSPGT